MEEAAAQRLRNLLEMTREESSRAELGSKRPGSLVSRVCSLSDYTMSNCPQTEFEAGIMTIL